MDREAEIGRLEGERKSEVREGGKNLRLAWRLELIMH